MKQILILLAFFITFQSFSQIVLEKKYVGDASRFFTVNLEGEGVKFGLISEIQSSRSSYSATITFYNANHSIYKSFKTPTLKKNVYPYRSDYPEIAFYNFSTKLFNTDSEIEYLIAYNAEDSSSGVKTIISSVEIYNENKINLLKVDSAKMIPQEGVSYVVYPFDYTIKGIVKIGNSCKLVLGNFLINGSIQDPLVYSLPGCLPEITTGIENRETEIKKASLSVPTPNPSQESAIIQFQLPENEKYGEVMVYNETGLRIKTYKVDGTFGDIILNNADLPSGTYYYNLLAGGKKSEGQKMLIIK